MKRDLATVSDGINLWIKVADNLAIEPLLRSSLVHKYFQRILPVECGLGRRNPQPIDIIFSTSKALNVEKLANCIKSKASHEKIFDTTFHGVVDAKAAKLAP